MIHKIEQIVRDASCIFLDGAKKSVPFDEKTGVSNYVTEYDKQIENYITTQLSITFPDVEFLGEEGQYNLKGTRCFVLDPIDGTANFIHHHRHSVISLAYCENDETVLAVVYNPEDDEMFTASKGGGAFLNGVPITVSHRPLSASLISFGTAPYHADLSEKSFKLAKLLFDYGEDLRRLGAAALQLCYLAAGREDFYFEFILQPWDFAAGMLVLSEAGGIAWTMDHTKLPCTQASSIVAGTPEAVEEFFSKDFLSMV